MTTADRPSAPAALPDAENLGELIADCSDIPPVLRTGRGELPLPRTAAPWSVNETCLAAVRDLDEYV